MRQQAVRRIAVGFADGEIHRPDVRQIRAGRRIAQDADGRHRRAVRRIDLIQRGLTGRAVVADHPQPLIRRKRHRLHAVDPRRQRPERRELARARVDRAQRDHAHQVVDGVKLLHPVEVRVAVVHSHHAGQLGAGARERDRHADGRRLTRQRIDERQLVGRGRQIDAELVHRVGVDDGDPRAVGRDGHRPDHVQVVAHQLVGQARVAGDVIQQAARHQNARVQRAHARGDDAQGPVLVQQRLADHRLDPWPLVLVVNVIVDVQRQHADQHPARAAGGRVDHPIPGETRPEAHIRRVPGEQLRVQIEEENRIVRLHIGIQRHAADHDRAVRIALRHIDHERRRRGETLTMIDEHQVVGGDVGRHQRAQFARERVDDQLIPRQVAQGRAADARTVSVGIPRVRQRAPVLSLAGRKIDVPQCARPAVVRHRPEEVLQNIRIAVDHRQTADRVQRITVFLPKGLEGHHRQPQIRTGVRAVRLHDPVTGARAHKHVD